MNMIYKYAVLPFATGDVRDAVNSVKWIAGELAESALMELSELKEKPNIAVRMTVVLEWSDEEKGCGDGTRL